MVHSGTTRSLKIGGIIGDASGTSFENCMSAGKITSDKGIVGSIAGYASSGSNVSHCYWTSDVGNYNISGLGSPTVTETSLIIPNTTTVDNLNGYNSSWNKWLLNTNNELVSFKVNNGNGFTLSSQLILLPSLAESEGYAFSGWYEDEECATKFNKSSVEDNATLYGLYGIAVTVTLDFGNGTTTTKTVVYGQKYGDLPTAERTGYSLGWLTESNIRVTSETKANITTGDHTLYARWTINSYTITFDFDNGTVVNEILNYNETITYPKTLTREGHSFNGWNSKPDRMPASDITVVAQWTINNYTLTFDFGNGTVINETYCYNETINYPENLTREGHTFNGWSPRHERMPAHDTTITAHWIINNYTLAFDYGNGTIISETLDYNETIFYPSLEKEGYTFNGWSPKPERMPANDTTVIAKWTEDVVSEFVEIIFDRKNMSEKDIKAALKDITDEEFTIVGFEEDRDTGETKVIIKFTDPEKANEFVRKVNEGRKPNIIKRASVVPPEKDSFSPKVKAASPVILFSLIFLG